MEARDYQIAAREAVGHALATSEDNPAVVIPTGGGKSFVIADCVSRWRKRCPQFRVCIVAHRKELVDQNAKELAGVWPEADIGIFSAGLGRHDTKNPIVYAGIDSIYDKADRFDPFSLIIVDEAHRIPVKGEGKYRRFIAECKARSPRMRVVGFTATPFRLDSGPICGKDYILNRIAYEADTIDLIRKGYLSRLDSMVGDAPDLSGIHKRCGDYDEKELSERLVDGKLVADTVRNALSIINARNRKKCIWFCVNVAHCEAIRAVIASYGETVDMIVGATPSAERDAAVERFRLGECRHLVNVSVFCEGFNVKDVDAVVLLRPTLSKGMYWQMVGRGLRTHPNKDYCAVLDYANLIDTHGALSNAEVENVGVVRCQCGYEYSKAFDECPKCHAPRPKELKTERERENEQKLLVERKMHDSKAANVDIMGEKPTTLDVSDVYIAVHVKDGAETPKSYRISWRCGLFVYNEWLCLWHRGYAKVKAMERFREITGESWDKWGGEDGDPYPGVSLEILEKAKARIGKIEVVKRGKFQEIVKHIEREDA